MGVPPGPRRRRVTVSDKASALRAQCGRDARDPSKRVESFRELHCSLIEKMADVHTTEGPALVAAPALIEPSPSPAAESRYDRSIIEGPLARGVWKIAWPTMLTNVIGGLQGMVDHVLVGNLVGYQANAAIGVAWQIFLVVIIFITSLFTGMSVLVARFVGAGEEEKVDRTVYQAFLTAVFISLGIMAPVGYFASPFLLDLVNAAPNVKAEALPFLRIMFVFSTGMMIFFMLGGALRSAGDARTPLILGVVMTVLNLVLNIILIRGLGPIPRFGTAGAAMGTCIASGVVACMHSLSYGAAAGSSRFRAKVSVRIGPSSGRFFDLVYQPAFRESR